MPCLTQITLQIELRSLIIKSSEQMYKRKKASGRKWELAALKSYQIEAGSEVKWVRHGKCWLEKYKEMVDRRKDTFLTLTGGIILAAFSWTLFYSVTDSIGGKPAISADRFDYLSCQPTVWLQNQPPVIHTSKHKRKGAEEMKSRKVNWRFMRYFMPEAESTY